MSELRNYLYKNNDKDSESLRKQRHNHSIELRKSKKNENLQKRRNIQMNDMPDDDDSFSSKENINPTNSIYEVCRAMRSNGNSTQQYEAVVMCRQMLSTKSDPPIDEFCKNGAVAILIDIMQHSNKDKMVFEATWALTNIASGTSENTNVIVQADGIKILIQMFRNKSEEVVDQCFWALSNIVGDCSEFRNMTFDYDIITEINYAAERFWNRVEIVRTLCWLISNLCRHKSKLYPVNEIKKLLPLMYKLIKNYKDEYVVSDLCWGLAYAADNHDDIIESLVDIEGMMMTIVDHLDKSTDLAAPSVRLIGNIIAGTHKQADAAIGAGAIGGISILLSRTHEDRIVKECCWVLSNVSAGTDRQILELIRSNVVSQILHVLRTGDYKSQKEAVWVVSNLATCRLNEAKVYLLNNCVFQSIIPLMTVDDVNIVKLLLDCVRDLFEFAEAEDKFDRCVDIFEECGGVDVVEKLQEHANEEIYAKAYHIVSEFLGIDQVEEAKNKYRVDPDDDDVLVELYRF